VMAPSQGCEEQHGGGTSMGAAMVSFDRMRQGNAQEGLGARPGM